MARRDKDSKGLLCGIASLKAETWGAFELLVKT
jgi:hypothetical protein